MTAEATRAHRLRSGLTPPAPVTPPRAGPTALLVAFVLAYADGFWIVSLRGAIGTVERVREPFDTWLRESTLSVPLFLVGALCALALAHRRFGPLLHGFRATLGTLVLLAAAGTVVGTGIAAANTAYDYRLQSAEVEAAHDQHTAPDGHPEPALAADPAQGADEPQHAGHVMAVEPCDAACRSLRTAAATDVRAVLDAAVVLGATNLVLVAWVVALRGGELDGPRRASATGDV